MNKNLANQLTVKHVLDRIHPKRIETIRESAWLIGKV